VDISGRIVLGEESAALHDEVLDLLSKGHKQILLNLADVNHIDSMGLGALVIAFASVRKQSGELKLPRTYATRGPSINRENGLKAVRSFGLRTEVSFSKCFPWHLARL
jgi:hypothetical protein